MDSLLIVIVLSACIITGVLVGVFVFHLFIGDTQEVILKRIDALDDDVSELIFRSPPPLD